MLYVFSSYRTEKRSLLLERPVTDTRLFIVIITRDPVWSEFGVLVLHMEMHVVTAGFKTVVRKQRCTIAWECEKCQMFRKFTLKLK